MRSVIFALVGIGLLFGVSFADSSLKTTKTYTITNTNAYDNRTFVNTSTIIPGENFIVGVSVMNVQVSASNQNAFATIYDASTAAQYTDANFLNEIEAINNQSTASIFYPYPKSLANGLCVITGPKTRTVVEYSR